MQAIASWQYISKDKGKHSDRHSPFAIVNHNDKITRLELCIFLQKAVQ